MFPLLGFLSLQVSQTLHPTHQQESTRSFILPLDSFYKKRGLTLQLPHAFHLPFHAPKECSPVPSETCSSSYRVYSLHWIHPAQPPPPTLASEGRFVFVSLGVHSSVVPEHPRIHPGLFSQLFSLHGSKPRRILSALARISSAANASVRSFGTRGCLDPLRLIRGSRGVASFVWVVQQALGWTASCAPQKNHTRPLHGRGGCHAWRTNSPWNGTRWYETDEGRGRGRGPAKGSCRTDVEGTRDDDELVAVGYWERELRNSQIGQRRTHG